MKNIIASIGLCLSLLCSSANAYVWSAAIPTEVHLIPEGLVLLGDFDNTGITCATGPKAVFLPASDVNFQKKLSMALSAIAMGKQIQVLINDPVQSSCVQVAAVGWVPTAYANYWRLK